MIMTTSSSCSDRFPQEKMLPFRFVKKRSKYALVTGSTQLDHP
jgi:hypothetical protein